MTTLWVLGFNGMQFVAQRLTCPEAVGSNRESLSFGGWYNHRYNKPRQRYCIRHIAPYPRLTLPRKRSTNPKGAYNIVKKTNATI